MKKFYQEKKNIIKTVRIGCKIFCVYHSKIYCRIKKKCFQKMFHDTSWLINKASQKRYPTDMCKTYTWCIYMYTGVSNFIGNVFSSGLRLGIVNKKKKRFHFLCSLKVLFRSNQSESVSEMGKNSGDSHRHLIGLYYSQTFVIWVANYYLVTNRRRRRRRRRRSKLS